MSDSANSGNTESNLLRAARRILRPLVRILLRNGITANVFQELARKVFVDVAHDEFGIDGKPQTLARVSVITGLNRKEVARLHKMEDVGEDDREWSNRAGTVLSAWLTEATYHTPAGFPLDLPFAGDSPSFSDLVKQYSGDMYPRAVADELLRTRAIEEVEGKLRMTERAFVPSGDPALMIDQLGLQTTDLLETIDHNLQTEPNEHLFQMRVRSINLPAKYLAEFNEYSKRISINAKDDIAHWLNEHDAGKDETGKDARYVAGIGIFQINQIVREKINEAQDGET